MIERVYELTQPISSYILKEKNYNTYIISDLEILGLHSNIIELYVGTNEKIINYVLMRYSQSFVLYSDNVKRMNIYEIKDFLESFKFDFKITGKKEVIEAIAVCFPEAEIDYNRFAVLKEKDFNIYSLSDTQVELVRNCNVEEVIQGYTGIEEYKRKYENIDSSRERIEKNNINGRYYGLKSSGKMIAMVCSAAESEELAMISEVGTKTEYRNKGFSKILVSNLCKDLFKSGKKELSIFYSNPVAERVYKAIGFKEKGEYLMLSNQNN